MAAPTSETITGPPRYTTIGDSTHLALVGVVPSIWTVGDAVDDALMEAINGLHRTECIRTTAFQSGRFRTLADVELATAGWVDLYKNCRAHDSLEMLAPVGSETLHCGAFAR